MDDRIINFIINRESLVLNYLGKLGIPTKKIYQNYHKKILSMIAKDLISAKNSMEKIKLREEKVEQKIWVMWWQGEENAPRLVINNLNRLRSIFGTDKVILITEKNFKNYTNIESFLYEKLQIGDITFALWSDIVRYNLLMNNGGLWIDSTVVLSKQFYDYYEKIKNKSFVSICNKEEDHKYISNNKWTGWLLGGQRNYELFRFVVSFFNTYYKNHTNQVDYFLVDDAVYFFYQNNVSFRKLIDEQLLEWNPYLFAQEYESTDVQRLMNLFNTERKYSVQKFSNKIKYNSKRSSRTMYYFLNQ